MSKQKKLYLIDGSALFYRSYFAFIRNPLINSKGYNTSAIFGFTSTLLKIITEEKPDYLAVVFDTKEPTFRHKKYEPYKATREKMPEEMIDQFPKIVEVVNAFNIPVIEKPGYEADDVIATLAKQAEKEKIETLMVTGDKDFMQLLTPLIKMYVSRPGKDVEIYDPDTLRDKLNMTPSQVVDYLALMGDSSDNIPGVPGVGEKTARQLLEDFHSLDNIYQNLDKINKNVLKEKLIAGKESAYLSKELVTIDINVPLDVTFEQMQMTTFDAEQLFELFEELEFRSMIDKISTLTGEGGKTESIQSLDQNYILINKKSQLDHLVSKLKKSTFFVFDTETTGLNVFDSEIIGISISLKPFEAFYIALNDPRGDFTSQVALKLLQPIFESPAIGKGGQNIKFDGLMLDQHGIELNNIQFDTMIAHYLLNPGTRQHNLDYLAKVYLNYEMIPIEKLIGEKGKKQKSMFDIDVDDVYPYACEDSDITFRLLEILQKQLKESNTHTLFKTLEMPLVAVLKKMEKNGVKIDVGFLSQMSKEVAAELKTLEKEIYKMAGTEFNLNSPQQLGKVLFDEMEIHKEFGGRRPKKTATGQYSTSEQVLEKYADHMLVGKILEFRKLSKLQSTYIDALPNLISKKTGRLHTSFNQTIAATGRLSSSDPNLQNIPIRTEIGREIRRAFVTSKKSDWILSADYSQIELRMMAHLSGDNGLKEAFKKGEDIHATTAAAVFNIPLEMVSGDQRRKAKEINFGIIYGISQFGLASRLKISANEAQEIIDHYFIRFPKVNEYMRKTIEFVQTHKYVTTIKDRRRNIPEIDNTNANIRQNAERMAINTTIQGSAADLIKVAMINIHNKLEKDNLKTKMILQVHDELVFEVTDSELDRVKKIVKHEMENAIKLDVPVKVDIGVGKNWLEAH